LVERVINPLVLSCPNAFHKRLHDSIGAALVNALVLHSGRCVLQESGSPVEASGDCEQLVNALLPLVPLLPHPRNIQVTVPNDHASSQYTTSVS